jgi:uncharacterized protein YnzC (UPF0291/DUF896 family)
MASKKIPNIVKLVKNYKQPTIDWSCQKVISHSQMTIYNSCNYRWGLHYRDGKKINTPSISLIFGIALHECIQEYLNVLYNQSKAAADRLDLETKFKDLLRSSYLSEYKKNKNKHFSSVEEIDEHCIDGLEILRYFKRKSGNYFSKKGYHLVGCEVPVNYNILPYLGFIGSLDIVLYHEPTDTIEIIDIKTSTRAWSPKYQQKDEVKLSQILLYKTFFSTQFDFPIEKINVKFLILKRKINENSEYKEKRIQEFSPASGKGKINKSLDLLNKFVFKAFDSEGNVIKEKFEKSPSLHNCKFCPYNDREDLCNKNKPQNKWRNPFTIE